MSRVALLLAFGLGALLNLPRLPVPSAGPGFAADRAMTLVATATEPRPSGSPAHGRMLDEVEGRLGAAGFVVDREVVRFEGRRLQNLVASAPGAGGEGVWLVAHSDSVPRAPGASDDGLGLAVVTEAAAVLARDWVPPELHVLVTDGEELGLLGARAFVEDHPGAGDGVGRRGGPASETGTGGEGERRLVINVEARGTEGPAYMFQTAGPVLDGWVASGCRAQASSLARAVYELLPNDTDFTVFRAAGDWGYDFALIHGAWRYHTPEDRPEHLDPRSVQQVGDCVVALARHWLGRWPAAREAAPPAGALPAYTQLFGWTVVVPDPVVRIGGLLLLLGLGRPRGRWLLGAGAWLAAVSVAAGVAVGIEALLLRWPPFTERPAEMAHPQGVWVLAAAVGVGSGLLFGRAPERAWGWTAVGVLLAAGLALTWPVVGWLWLMPGLAGVLLLRGGPAWVAALIAGLLLGPILHAVFPALTTRLLPALAVLPLLTGSWLLGGPGPGRVLAAGAPRHDA